jgi:hypothetical protein
MKRCRSKRPSRALICAAKNNSERIFELGGWRYREELEFPRAAARYPPSRPPEYEWVSRRLKLASLRRESSNQLLETLEEWNDYLER